MLRAVHTETTQRWRRTWEIGGAAAACAAVVGAALLIAPPSRPRAVAAAQVAQATRSAPLVRQDSDAGWIVWEAPGRFLARKKNDGSYAAFWDFRTLRHATYDARHGRIMVAWCDVSSGVEASAQTIRDLVAEIESWDESFATEWQQRDQVIDGRRLLELIPPRKPGQRYRRVVVDPVTGRLVTIEYLDHRVDFSYPARGPKDIYELGVPRNAAVIDGTPSPQLRKLHDKVVAAMIQGFGAYRMVRISTGGEVFRYITDGRRYRLDGIRLAPERAQTLEQIRALAKEYGAFKPLGRRLTHTSISNGSYVTSIYYDENGVERLRQVGGGRIRETWIRRLEGSTWWALQGAFWSPWPDRQDEFIGPNERGWVGKRERGQASHIMRPYLIERWHDPKHGYAIALHRKQTFPKAEWQLIRKWQEEYENHRTPILRPGAYDPPESVDSEVLEWGTLRPGQWYPPVTRTRTFIQGEDGAWHERQGPGYSCIVAEPVENIDEQWFQIPPAPVQPPS